jgi:hypothetical protein
LLLERLLKHDRACLCCEHTCLSDSLLRAFLL